MSTKRLAKRSILGSRVCAVRDPGEGLYHPCTITSSSTDEGRFTVRFEDGSERELGADELVGPGFRPWATELRQGQRVFLTHNGREVSATVVGRTNGDLTLISLANGPALPKRPEELRLTESRKSARLQDVDTNYSKLADGQGRRRTSSFSIEVPPSGRKRRPSADGDVMDDCTAALVLMHLSCSPKSPRLPTTESGVGSDAWSTTTTSSTSPPQSQDEGIDLDEYLEDFSGPRIKTEARRTVFQCMWPGCGNRYRSSVLVERHIRTQHLGRSPKEWSDSDSSSDHEEDFYYTEIEEEDDDSDCKGRKTIYASSAPTLSHLDMVRPPHEDPEYKQQLQLQQSTSAINIPLHYNNMWSTHIYAASAPTSTGSPQKCMKLTPRSPPAAAPPKLTASPVHKRGRAESRKCRKVYGMENRDLWCTQCKWKKACSRFAD